MRSLRNSLISCDAFVTIRKGQMVVCSNVCMYIQSRTDGHTKKKKKKKKKHFIRGSVRGCVYGSGDRNTEEHLASYYVVSRLNLCGGISEKV